MSRIGKKPITIPSGVSVTLSSDLITVKGLKGELKEKIHPLVRIEIKDNQVLVNVTDPEEKKQRALWGLYGSLISNMIKGVTQGFAKQLEVNGVGYKVALQGRKLILNLGFSHPIEFELPAGIEAKVEKNVISIIGFDKQLVGETAARIRNLRKPEPYKGKGIKYIDEVLRHKAGKAAAATAK